MIEPFASVHVDAVARLHYRSLTGLLRDLGPRAIKAFYIGAIQSGCAIAFVVLEQGILQGFVFGSSNPQQLKRDALRNNFFQILVGIFLGVLRKPSTLVSLWRSTSDKSVADYNTHVAELTYLAVDEKHRSASLGQKLVDRFGQALSEHGISAYELSVDADNSDAIGFYQRLNFIQVGEYQEFGVTHIRYRMDFD